MRRRAFQSPMLNKPFKPPSSLGAQKQQSSSPAIASTPASSTTAAQTPETTKPQDENTTTITTSTDHEVQNTTTPTPPTPQSSLPRKRPFKPPAITKPMQPVASAGTANGSSTATGYRYFTVLFAKNTNKKNKSFEDGVLIAKTRKYTLQNIEGKVVCERTVARTIDMAEGDEIELGGYVMEITKQYSEDEFTSGRIFMQFQNLAATRTKPLTNRTEITPFKKPKGKSKQSEEEKQNEDESEATVDAPTVKAIRRPRREVAAKVLPTPADAFVLNEGHPETDENGKPIYDVYVDPFLARQLRPHQREGVKFMFECVMGMRGIDGCGCLLADEMGLGKTLQSIALFYTLLRCGPSGVPVCKKVVIVTPSSLVQNWAKEIKKWLGTERCNPVVVSPTRSAKSKPIRDVLHEFSYGYQSVLIISYDLCRNNSQYIQKLKCDLLICDEGHRLKNNSIKTTQTLAALSTRRRVLLSGTPLQNDLGELYSMVDFINPGLLGSPLAFKRLFSDPIMKSREPSATDNDKSVGAARSESLSKTINSFVLRRTSDVLNKLLPPKLEILVFCYMSELQKVLYRHFIKRNIDNGSTAGGDNFALSCINALKKLLTHPRMIYQSAQENSDWSGASKLFPTNFLSTMSNIAHSGKMQVLASFLREIRISGDKVVVVSNYTSSLDQMESLLQDKGYSFVRLDGSTPSDKRMPIVERFNDKHSEVFCFLLSSKAGGVGLNLIGANRLILFDPDWNPSNDLQAMARVWRDGQQKNVFIYRFISTGTIEEKIFQRQIVKLGLSKTVVDEQRKNLKASFSKEELKALFRYNSDTRCDTFSSEADASVEDADVDVVEDDESASDPNSIEAIINRLSPSLKKEDPVLFNAVTRAQVRDIVSFVKPRYDADTDKEIIKDSVKSGDDENLTESGDNEPISSETPSSPSISAVRPMDEGEAEFVFDEPMQQADVSDIDEHDNNNNAQANDVADANVAVDVDVDEAAEESESVDGGAESEEEDASAPQPKRRRLKKAASDDSSGVSGDSDSDFES